MKIKRKEGPHEFLVWMNLKVKKPRAYKLLMRRETLREQVKVEPEKLFTITRKIHRVDLELQRLAKSLKKEGFNLEFQGSDDPILFPKRNPIPRP